MTRRRTDDLGAFLEAIEDDDPAGSAAGRVAVIAPGLVVEDRYELGERVGKGGMASIWRAFDRRSERPVAIKFLDEGFAANLEQRLRFAGEASAAAAIDSPHVARTYDYGVHRGRPFIVMEQLEGEDLFVRLKQTGVLSFPMLAEIARGIGAGLAAAHAANVIHRDLKPRNVFLARCGDGETVKLLDFGLAKHEGTSALMTATGIIAGSPHFMSPEQIAGTRDIDARADLWSFAIILYRAVAGELPFRGTGAAVITDIISSPPRPASRNRADLPPAVDAFFARALTKHRDGRFASATEMTKAFLAALARAGEVTVDAPDEARPILSSIETVDGASWHSGEPVPTSPRRARRIVVAFVVVLLVGITVLAVLALHRWPA